MQQSRLLRAAAWGAQRAPNWFVAAAPALIGIVAMVVAGRARRAVLSNLRRIYGRRGLWPTLRDVALTFINFAYGLTESLAPERFLKIEGIHIEAHEESERLLAQGASVVATAHVGPWDAAAMAFPKVVGPPVLMLMSGERAGTEGTLQDDVRREAAIGVVRLSGAAFDALPALNHLENGGAVVGQMDRAFGHKRPLRVQFFGGDFDVPPGLIRLAAMTHSPLIPVFMARLPQGRRLVHIAAPIIVLPRPSRAQQQQAAQAYASELEKHLRRFPTQWFHFVEERKLEAQS